MPANPTPALAEIEGLLARATQGLWRVGRQDGAPRDHLVDMGDPPKAPYFRMHKGLPDGPGMRGVPPFGIVESDDAPAEEIAANAALIVALKNAAPQLIARIRALEVDNSQLRAAGFVTEDELIAANERIKFLEIELGINAEHNAEMATKRGPSISVLEASARATPRLARDTLEGER